MNPVSLLLTRQERDGWLVPKQRRKLLLETHMASRKKRVLKANLILYNVLVYLEREIPLEAHKEVTFSVIFDKNNNIDKISLIDFINKKISILSW